MNKSVTLLLILWTTFIPVVAVAGSSEVGKAKLPEAQVAGFADQVQRDLAAKGAHVAIVARMGRDPRMLPEGINYTHVSFWVYSQITQADGRQGQGYRVYNLYQLNDNQSRSHLVQDSPADFFAGAQTLKAGIIIPDVRLQQKLLQVIASPIYAALHNPRYSVLANPADGRFQNCTEHTLDVLFASLYGTGNRQQIKANIGAHFQPHVVRIGGLKRALAPVASQALVTSDHGQTVATATFGSIARFMQANDLEARVYEIGR